MSNRKITPFELSQAINKLNSETVFDRLVKEVDAKEIPAEYIEYMSVLYKDGSAVQLTGNELTSPIPVNKNASWNEMEDTFKQVENIRVYIDTKKLEIEVTKQIDSLFKDKLL